MYKLIKNSLIISLILSIIFVMSSCGKTQIEPTSAQATQETTDNTVRLTFPEGYSALKIADKLEKNHVCTRDEFLNEVNNKEYLEEFGIEIENPEDRAFLLEGYLFPDTYDFFIGENPSSVIRKFLRNTFSRLTDEMLQRAKELGYNTDELLNLASVIQGEAGGAAQSSTVASVLYNRLNSNEFRRIECDATISYLKRSVKPVVDENRYDELCELYNTYMCYGLPAGPIGNAGMTSINAALYPEDTDYYYFVTDSEGNFFFAETLAEHKINCQKVGLTG